MGNELPDSLKTFYHRWEERFECPQCNNMDSDKWSYNILTCYLTCLNCGWRISDERRYLWHTYTLPGDWITTEAGGFEVLKW